MEIAPPWFGGRVATDYPDCLEIIEKKVKIIRQLDNRKAYRDYWWHYAEKRGNLYRSIIKLKRYLVISRVTKNANFSFLNRVLTTSEATVIIALENYRFFSILNCNIHDVWAWKNSSTLGEGTLRYSGSEAFETFPFPQYNNHELKKNLDSIGEVYHEYRKQLMLWMQLGLTKTYNAFHAKEVQTGVTTTGLSGLDKKTIEKQYGKEVWNLWNHLQKTPGTCNIEEAVAGIIKLRELHVQMDEAVLEAYGWNPSPTLPKVEGVELRHDFYEVDYLPENDRVRYTIHPDARKEILKRLLELNHKIHDEEVKAGLWDKKKTYGKVKGTKEVGEPEEGYGQGKLF